MATGSDKVDSFFGQPAYLTVSGQLHVEALALAAGPVYTLGPTFRAEKSRTPRHLAEFWMAEVEIPFVDTVDQVCDSLEGALASACEHVERKCAAELDIVRSNPEFAVKNTLRPEHFEQPLRRITYTNAIDILKSAEAASPTPLFESKVDSAQGLSHAQEQYLVQHFHHAPVFVTHYPRSIKPFYMKQSPPGQEGTATPGETVESFDLLVPVAGELAGGSLREDRLVELEANLQRANIDGSSLDWYVDLRRYGSVPHGGYGIGIERLTQAIAGLVTVRDVPAMPRAYGIFRF